MRYCITITKTYEYGNTERSGIHTSSGPQFFKILAWNILKIQILIHFQNTALYI